MPQNRFGPRFWAICLGVNCLVLVSSVGVIGARVYRHLSTPAVSARPESVKKQPPRPQPKPEEPEPEPKKAPEPEQKQAPKKEPVPEAVLPKEISSSRKPLRPLPNPSLAADPAPRRDTPALQSASAKIKPIKDGAKRATVPVGFEHSDPSAKEVALLGMFLVRNGGRTKMFKDSKGVWRSTQYLKTGQSYEYRFEIVDSKGGRKTTPPLSIAVPE